MGLAAEKRIDPVTKPESTKQPDEHPEELLGEPEPWQTWETKLCLYSIGIGLLGLAILGVLINLFILNK